MPMISQVPALLFFAIDLLYVSFGVPDPIIVITQVECISILRLNAILMVICCFVKEANIWVRLERSLHRL
jgi:hypothetical protein